MDLNDFFGPDLIVIDLQAENRWQAIDELIDCLAANGKIKPENRDAIVTSVKRREHSMTTGIGFGVALPHASTDLVSNVIAVMGRSRNGVQFDSSDGKPVHQVVLFLVPQGQFQKHINTLSNLAKLLHRPDFRDGL